MFVAGYICGRWVMFSHWFVATVLAALGYLAGVLTVYARLSFRHL